MTCPRCGSANVYSQRLSKWLRRWTCRERECRHTWAEQTGELPPTEPNT